MLEEDYTYVNGEWIYSGPKGKEEPVYYELLKKKKNLTPLEKQILKYCERMMTEKSKKKK